MNVKHGFSTLNRLLGKKNKGHHLSKSTTNLSLSSHIDKSSSLSSHQLEQNRITPLPIATTNAPFEQNFRITVLLPKGQLYVARLGAKTTLQKLLEIVCENKQLDQEKYEFRHPVDSSQVFSCELTIGAVGLNEIRLCHKSEAYDNFNADEIIKLRHTGRDSLSSSEFSSRNSKHTLKTASPYSSTNSLNSVDSAGMSTTYRGQIVSLPPIPSSVRSFGSKQNNIQPPVAPARKKRVAPRPPSQNSIPEKEPVNGYGGNSTQEPRQSIPKKDFHLSSPNLMTQSAEFTTLRSADFHRSNVSIDCNGNTSNRENSNTTSTTINTANNTRVPISNGNLSNGHHSFCRNDSQSSTESNGFQKTKLKTRPVSMSAINDESNHNGNDTGSEENGMVNGSTETLKVPEPIPRKRIIAGKKKAPAPPPRTFSIPVALPRNSTVTNEQETIKNDENVKEIEKPKLNGSLPREIAKSPESVNGKLENKSEIMKKSPVQINKEKEKLHTNTNTDSTPTVEGSQTPSSPQTPASDVSQSCLKPAFETSSDEDEQIKVYNLKLGKTIVKPLVEHKTYEDLSTISSLNSTSVRDETVKSPEIDPETPTWEYTIPAPPNFADNSSVQCDSTKTNICKKDSESSTNSSDVLDSSLLVEKNAVNLEKRHSIISKTSDSLTKMKKSEIIITSDIKNAYCGSQDKQERPNKIDETERKNNITDVAQIEDKLESFRTSNNISSPSSIESIDCSRKDVITQLNNVLNENKLDTVITRSEHIEEIESPKPCALSNFKIQSYTFSSGMPNVNDLPNTENEKLLRNSPKSQEVKLSEQKEIVENISMEKQKAVVSEHEETKNPITPAKQKKGMTVDIRVSEDIPLVNGNKELVSTYLNEEIISIQFQNNEEKQEKPINFEIEKEKSPKPHLEEERLYKKRSNVTSNNGGGGGVTPQIFKSRVSITRSDSFHSTRYPNSLDHNSLDNCGMSLRSSSYVSLLNAQNLEQNRTSLSQPFSDTNRRKSASELSIGESPSLQSLIVMKSILNSRKGSLTTENDLQNGLTFNSKPYTNGYTENEKPLSRTAYDDSDSSKENSPKNKMLSSQEIVRNNVVDRKEEQQPEKKWKYQGPPSINLTSWSERPKIQVSIKNDGDYKFGVGGAGIGGTSTSITTFPRVYRNSTSNHAEATNAPINSVRIIGEQPKVPFVRSVEYKKSTGLIDSPAASDEVNKPINSSTTTASTTTVNFGRIPKMINRTASFAPTVKGFRNITNENGYHSLKTDFSAQETIDKSPEIVNGVNENNSVQQPKINLQTWKSSTNSLGRSNSVVTTYSTKFTNQSTEPRDSYVNHNGHNGTNGADNNRDVEESPFSKIVLRKTGLKEKIMSTPNDHDTSPKSATLVKIDNQNCAKLEMKLTTTVPQNAKPKTPIKTPPPPPPPVIRSVVAKQKVGAGSLGNGSSVPNTRDELLSAIRNFKKDSLKRS